jgi:hypothetical protein
MAVAWIEKPSKYAPFAARAATTFNAFGMRALRSPSSTICLPRRARRPPAGFSVSDHLMPRRSAERSSVAIATGGQERAFVYSIHFCRPVSLLDVSPPPPWYAPP